jgi:hypothetical protein
MLGIAAAMSLSASTASAAVITFTNFDAFQSAAGSLITESFDSGPWLPANSNLSQGLTNLGVSWTAANSLYSGVISRSGLAVTSLDGTLGGTDLFDWIEAVLPADTMAVGGWITSFNQVHVAEMRAFDVLDNLLGTISIDRTGHDFAFLGLTSDTAIAKVRFAATGVTIPLADDIALDDFVFGGVPAALPVPEPSAIALFGVGALAAVVGRRRRPHAAKHGEASGLDRRLLSDIGIGRGAILSAARHVGVEQLRHSTV